MKSQSLLFLLVACSGFSTYGMSCESAEKAKLAAGGILIAAGLDAMYKSVEMILQAKDKKAWPSAKPTVGVGVAGIVIGAGALVSGILAVVPCQE